MSTWQPIRVRDLVVGARIQTNGLDCPMIRTVAARTPEGKYLHVQTLDGWASMLLPDAEVWACLPEPK